MQSDPLSLLKQDLQTLYEWLLARDPSSAEIEAAASGLAEKRISREQPFIESLHVLF